ncbi:transporter substrate-binding domain-containing protein [Paraburkholderia sp. Ac-20340]|uniref:transporter substrate-binding and LysM peptidoglycan-binding domain-containing protein n=1 Tax=Paraburkholderia sp. Ac-20340 TaxID=2703888 RepID=UPI00197E6ADB|nr:transporter substrate-binding domain-containing protein [Paraburkholderia sp. Ac-20340]MBN3856952.1 transporter substrate-binding domain-containing protein [Paraburkholderia sp. Ac-20340]
MQLTTGAKRFLGLVASVAIVYGAYYAWQHGLIGKHGDAQQPAAALDVGNNTTSTTSTSSLPATPQTAQQPAPQPIPASFTPNADTRQQILQNHVVRISVENPSEPIYGETNGTPHGFNYEFAKLLFGQPEFNANGPVTIDTHHEVSAYKDVPRQLLASDNGVPAVDIAMDGLTFPDNTPAGVLYTNPYLDDFGYALIVQKNSAIHSTADLAGKTVGILQGDPDVKAFVTRQYPNTQFVEVNDADDQFINKAVDGHQVDAFIYDYPFAVESIKGSDLKFAQTKLDGSSISYKIGVRANDQNLLVYLNSAIGRVKQSPAYLDLLRKYFRSNQADVIAASHGEHTYAVKRGDTLNTIAAAQLGTGSRYRDIQRRNNLPNPNLILVGEQLVIPVR